MSKALLAAGLLFPLAPHADDRILVQGIVRNVAQSQSSNGSVADLNVEATLGKDRPEARRVLVHTDAWGRFQLEWSDPASVR
jgi:hypothetical protein